MDRLLFFNADAHPLVAEEGVMDFEDFVQQAPSMLDVVGYVGLIILIGVLVWAISKE